ncbi:MULTISPECIES: leucyl/phenylalanyl-tRNA--protein transferase [Protofrankia]|uniref:Leucyl/phenylalanyl-tRNA--protein transferase n=1 Tax=Protofrankia coriariae TaxID=1562887 RepID=A0ABR5F3J3_9ACTN|nr:MULTISPECIES: leucyl/phenylalanyl-tRNA--protein transferase [Protofrankia]KLL11294.1 leucyl-tRNA--protein transferase [Protofrankia coriariae]ONH33773.1 leucyl/phenylalanyl-tRNA--protein transferase [Protofrankia sp. BMG5.30]
MSSGSTDPGGTPRHPGWSLWDAVAEVDPADPGDTPFAFGGDLSPATLVGAYRRGVFPWPLDEPAGGPTTAANAPGPRDPAATGTRPPVLSRDAQELSRDARGRADIAWWSPDPRGVLPIGGVRVPESLFKRMRACDWTTTLDQAFADVVHNCGQGTRRTWITTELAGAYQELHRLGWAHSIEVWQDDELIGGMFGVLVGAVFMAESMFHVRTDASKVALVDFDARFAPVGGRLVDVQFVTAHAKSMGAVEIPRVRFLTVLRQVRDAEVRLDRGRLPVTRLAELARQARKARHAQKAQQVQKAEQAE